MSDTSDNTTAATVDGVAATEGVEQPHAAVSSDQTDVMIAGEQTCARCTGYAQELALLHERNETLTQSMKQMESDKIASMTLAHTREQAMFAASAKSEVAIQALQGDKDLLMIRVQQAESNAAHASSELAQAVDNNFCYEPFHKALQDTLDGANCELAELRARDITLEEQVNNLQECLTAPKTDARPTSLLGRKMAEGRRISSSRHPTMDELLAREAAVAAGIDEGVCIASLITGSELVIAGGIPRKAGNRRFTCFGNANVYHDQVQRSLAESDLEAADAGDSEDKNKHGSSLDTSVPKTLKGAMVINSDSDKLQELKIKNRDHMDISKFVTAVTHILRSNKAEFLAAESLGGFAEYQEVVGAVSGINSNVGQKNICVPQHPSRRKVL